ncbi:hypothetical protein A2U01_0099498, partial [Trifolium medium]|nr:hypothetical protein [Trifolium medium]
APTRYRTTTRSRNSPATEKLACYRKTRPIHPSAPIRHALKRLTLKTAMRRDSGRDSGRDAPLLTTEAETNL